MPKKTLALICGLVAVTFILFVIALNNNNNLAQQKQVNQQQLTQTNQDTANNQQSVQPTVQIQAKSVLSILQNPVDVIPGQRSTVAVNIDTSGNQVTAIQLEIAYDPNIITNVQVTPGDIITNPVVLINNNRVKEGRYTYAYGITPNNPVIQGTGKAASITFTALNKTGLTSQLALLPESLVTARGVSESVLQSGASTLIKVSQSGANTVEE